MCNLKQLTEPKVNKQSLTKVLQSANESFKCGNDNTSLIYVIMAAWVVLLEDVCIHDNGIFDISTSRSTATASGNNNQTTMISSKTDLLHQNRSLHSTGPFFSLEWWRLLSLTHLSPKKSKDVMVKLEHMQEFENKHETMRCSPVSQFHCRCFTVRIPQKGLFSMSCLRRPQSFQNNDRSIRHAR